MQIFAWIAVDDHEKSTRGVCYAGKKLIKSSVESYDEAKQEELSAWTVKTLAADEQEKRNFELVR